MFEEKVNRDTATAEVNKWLDAKKITSAKRVTYKDHIESMVDGVMFGTLSIGTDNVITHTLEIPIEIAGATTNSITYKPRLTVADVKAKTANIKGSDSEGRILAYLSALSGVTVAVLERMDTGDFGVAGSIALFFM